MQLVALFSNENVCSAQWLCGFIVTLEIQIQSQYFSCITWHNIIRCTPKKLWLLILLTLLLTGLYIFSFTALNTTV